jgi:micrococcal nuclease
VADESRLYTYQANVTSVYDGDTLTVDIDLGFSIVLRKQTVRLVRINTPELRGSTQEKGLAARDALRSRVLGKSVILKTIKDSREKYGRWLGEVWVDGECINDWMLSEGLAVKYM